MNRKLNTQEQNVFNLLKRVIDPELMINIIDLGLVYDVSMNDAEHKVKIELTLTSPGCPLGDVIMEDIQQVVEANYADYQVEVVLVWEPTWTLERLTTEGKEALGRT